MRGPPLVEVVRSPGRDVVAGEHVGERGVVPDPPRDLECLARQRGPGSIRTRERQPGRQARHHPGAQRALARRRALRAPVPAGRRVAGSRPRPPRSAPVLRSRAPRGPAARARRAVGELGREAARLAGLVDLARAPARVGEREQQLAEPRLVGLPGPLERLQAALVVSGGVFVGEARGCAVVRRRGRRRPPLRPGRRRAASAKWCASASTSASTSASASSASPIRRCSRMRRAALWPRRSSGARARARTHTRPARSRPTDPRRRPRRARRAGRPARPRPPPAARARSSAPRPPPRQRSPGRL